MEQLVKEFEEDIEDFRLIPSDGGKFELEVNDKLLYSKLKMGRHVEEGELVELVRKYWQKNN